MDGFTIVIIILVVFAIWFIGNFVPDHRCPECGKIFALWKTGVSFEEEWRCNRCEYSLWRKRPEPPDPQ